MLGPGGVLGRNETERLAVAEFAQQANMPHRPIYEGKMYRPSAEQVCAQYAENPVFEASFESIEETFNTSNGAVRQIAIILAPDVEDVVSGKKFRMKTGNRADAVSVPLYLARVKDVKRVSSSTDPNTEKRLVSWEYYTPQTHTRRVGEDRLLGAGKAGHNTSWVLDSKNPQLDAEFHRSELILLWEMSDDRILFPAEQYTHAMGVLNAVPKCKAVVEARREARDRGDQNVDESTDEEDSDASEDA
jgi:hypothetical protein